MMASNLTRPLSSNCDAFDSNILNVTLASLYFLIFPLALLLNGVAAWVCLHLRTTSTFIVYLKNLVAADLLVALTIPLKASGKLPGSSLGLRVFNCRYNNVIFFTCMYMSITLMGLISLDRFFKIVRPGGKSLGQNLVFGRAMSVCVWVMLVGGTTLPSMILTQESSNGTDGSCLLLKSPEGLIFHKCLVIFMDVLFWAVAVLVVVCYICITNKVLQSFRNSGSSNSQGKRKTQLRVFLVLIVFLVCFVPFHIVRIPFTLHEIQEEESCTATWVRVANDIALCLSTTNICLDPLLYIFLCREFKEKLVDMMKRVRIPLQLASSTTENTSQ